MCQIPLPHCGLGQGPHSKQSCVRVKSGQGLWDQTGLAPVLVLPPIICEALSQYLTSQSPCLHICKMGMMLKSQECDVEGIVKCP